MICLYIKLLIKNSFLDKFTITITASPSKSVSDLSMYGLNHGSSGSGPQSIERILNPLITFDIGYISNLQAKLLNNVNIAHTGCNSIPM